MYTHELYQWKKICHWNRKIVKKRKKKWGTCERNIKIWTEKEKKNDKEREWERKIEGGKWPRQIQLVEFYWAVLKRCACCYTPTAIPDVGHRAGCVLKQPSRRLGGRVLKLYSRFRLLLPLSCHHTITTLCNK